MMDPLKSHPGVANRQRKRLGIATIVLSVLGIGILTLTPGHGPVTTHFQHCLACGTFGAADFVLNVVLFVPLGLGLRLIGLERRYAWGTAFGLTVGIETLQRFVIPGRESSLGDIVSNTTGGILGVALADASRLLLFPSRQWARGLVILWAVVIGGLDLATRWATGWSLPQRMYYEQVVPELGQFDVLEARVLSATLNGAPFREGPLSQDSSTRVRSALLDGNAHFHVTALFGRAPSFLAPIVSIYDDRSTEIAVIGRQQSNLIVRWGCRICDKGWHPPALVFSNALPKTLSRFDTVQIAVDFTPHHVVIESKTRATVPYRAVGQFGLADSWRFLVPDDRQLARYANIFTISWLVAVLLPVAYWCAQCVIARDVT